MRIPLTAAASLAALLLALAGPAAAHCTYGEPTPQKTVQAPPSTPPVQAPMPGKNG